MIMERPKKDIEKEYWETLEKVGKFNSPKLSALRKELKEHSESKVECVHVWGASYGQIYRHQMCDKCGEEKG